MLFRSGNCWCEIIIFMKIDIEFFASAKAAAKTSQVSFEVEDVKDLESKLIELGGQKLIEIVKVSSILSNGQKIELNQIKEDSNIQILPPFAGG